MTRDPNWFLGLPLRHATGLLEALRDAPDGIRPVLPADLHVTVAFLGPVGEVRARAAYERARDAPRDALRAITGPTTLLGPRRRRWAIAVTFEEGADALGALLAELGPACRAAAGLEPDERAPLPHATLAAIRDHVRGAARDELVAWAEALPTAGVVVRFDTLALYTRAAPQTGSRYGIVAESRLVGDEGEEPTPDNAHAGR